jgi:hypothetical protein
MPDFAFKAILPLYWCILIVLCWRRARLLPVLLACLAMPVSAIVMLAAVNFATPRLPAVFDPVAIGLDGSLGFQPVSLVAGLFETCRTLKAICFAAYMYLTATVAVSAGLEMRSGRMQGIGVVPTFLFAGCLAYALYFVMPVVGPFPYLGGDFAALLGAGGVPVSHMDYSTIPRNCVPSMHTSWAVLAFLATRQRHFAVRCASFLFMVLTLLATIGFGHHYLVDLVVAAPFVLLVRALCAVRLPWAGERLAGAAAGTMMLAAWCLVVRGWLPAAMLPMVPAAMLASVIVSITMEMRIARGEAGRVAEGRFIGKAVRWGRRLAGELVPVKAAAGQDV